MKRSNRRIHRELL